MFRPLRGALDIELPAGDAHTIRMALDRKAKWSYLPVIAALLAGLMTCGLPTPSEAHPAARTNHTGNCEAPLVYQPIEKPIGERGLKNRERNSHVQRMCRHEPAVQEPAYYDRWHLEDLRWPSNSNADACLDDTIIESKACP